MPYDVDLMRDLLFESDGLQTSPRSMIVVSLDAEAIALGRSVVEAEAGLEGLLDLAYIDGPGAEVPGFFLFRKLTAKGAKFVRATRRPRDWQRLKTYFAARRRPDTA